MSDKKNYNSDGSPILPPAQHVIAGHCGKCGAPYFIYSGPWFGVQAPPPVPSCACWNRPQVITTTNTRDIK